MAVSYKVSISAFRCRKPQSSSEWLMYELKFKTITCVQRWSANHNILFVSYWKLQYDITEPFSRELIVEMVHVRPEHCLRTMSAI